MRQFIILTILLGRLFCSTMVDAQPTQNGLFDVAVLDSLTVVVVGGNGTLLRTIDGGETWSQQISSAKTFLSVHFVDKTIGWVVGEDGVTRKTTNGGKRWLRQPLSAPELHGVYFVDGETGWAVGRNGFIAKTIDGGESWEVQHSGTTSQLESVHFFDADTGWIVGRSPANLKTTDGGKTWNSMSTQNWTFLSTFFVTKTNGWAVGFGSQIAYTIDSGNTWNLQTPSPSKLGSSRKVFFIDLIRGWIVGKDADDLENGSIIATIDGGATWNRQTTISNTVIWGIDFYDAQNGWAVGDHGTMLKTTDSGSNWTLVQGQLVGVEEREHDVLPAALTLEQNYPNPISLTQATNNRHAQTTIAYELVDAAHVNLAIYDILGRAVRTLVNNENPAGIFHVSWNGTDESNRPIASGIYFYRMHVQPINSSEPLVRQMKMLITK